MCGLCQVQDCGVVEIQRFEVDDGASFAIEATAVCNRPLVPAWAVPGS